IEQHVHPGRRPDAGPRIILRAGIQSARQDRPFSNSTRSRRRDSQTRVGDGAEPPKGNGSYGPAIGGRFGYRALRFRPKDSASWAAKRR
ncbi:hypothetical protein, partial [Enterococcus faecium]